MKRHTGFLLFRSCILKHTKVAGTVLWNLSIKNVPNKNTGIPFNKHDIKGRSLRCTHSELWYMDTTKNTSPLIHIQFFMWFASEILVEYRLQKMENRLQFQAKSSLSSTFLSFISHYTEGGSIKSILRFSSKEC